MSNDKLIQDYEAEFFEPPCLPGAEEWTVDMHLEADIEDLLPYLNAELDGARLQEEASALLWQHEGHKYAFRPRKVSIGGIEDKETGRELCERTAELLNDVWSRRGEIEPSHEAEKKSKASALEVYRHLPGDNCGECGRPTCMAFATALGQGEAAPDDCPEMDEEARDEVRRLIE